MSAVLGATILSLLADRLLGEPSRWHPLIAFGRFADYLEVVLNRRRKLSGLVAWLLAVLPLTLAGWLFDVWLGDLWLAHCAAGGAFLYLAIGWQSLLSHAGNVAEPLGNKDLAAARRAAAMMVSRDTGDLPETDVAAAATESVLENGNDAIFAPLFWFWVGGIPAVILYRLANTLDAMWGYRSDRFAAFGWVAARTDDLLNWIPARLTALSYAICGNTGSAIACWRAQAARWKSPNAGPVMASGAGAIGATLGGAANYGGRLQQRPQLGAGEVADATTIEAACKLVNRALLLWILVLILLTMII